jgi:hypothetical protein
MGMIVRPAQVVIESSLRENHVEYISRRNEIVAGWIL